MPYINQKERDELEASLQSITNVVKKLHQEGHGRAGLLNYSVTRILNELYPDPRYQDHNEIIGLLECIKQEFYRVKTGPYEDLKMKENGAVQSFNSSEYDNNLKKDY